MAIAETASPLGRPGFAFTLDARRAVIGWASSVAGAEQTNFADRFLIEFDRNGDGKPITP